MGNSNIYLTIMKFALIGAASAITLRQMGYEKPKETKSFGNDDKNATKSFMWENPENATKSFLEENPRKRRNPSVRTTTTPPSPSLKRSPRTRRSHSALTTRTPPSLSFRRSPGREEI